MVRSFHDDRYHRWSERFFRSELSRPRAQGHAVVPARHRPSTGQAPVLMRWLCGGQAVSPVIFLSRYYRPLGPVVPLGRVLQIHRESRLYRDEDRLYRCSAKKQ